MKLVTAYEREKISNLELRNEDIVSFDNFFPGVAHFLRDTVTFYQSGIYQVGSKCTILVLPWIFKDYDLASLANKSSAPFRFLDLINEINEIKSLSVGLNGNIEEEAIELLAHSFLRKALAAIEKISIFAHHCETTESLHTLRGRWDLLKDLRKTKRPLKFSCTYSTLTKDSPFLVLLKGFLFELKRMLYSRKNQSLIEQSLTFLDEVTCLPPQHSLINEAKTWLTRFKCTEFLGLVDFIESFSFGTSKYSPHAGLCYQFSMDKFFEQVIESLAQMLPSKIVRTQERFDVLGGGAWEANADLALASTSPTKNARTKSIPDVIIIGDVDYTLIECKYKPLRIPLINGNSPDQSLDAFGRNDRNQLLSFILGIAPSGFISNKKVTISLAFPCAEVDSFKTSDLVFDSAKLYLDAHVRNLIQNTQVLNKSDMLRIRFVGINVFAAIEAITTNNPNFIQEIFKELTSSHEAEEVSPTRVISNFEKNIQRRAYLASLILDSSHEDRNLGRTKMAKILYLADSHLKLNLQANYQRQAAGPLDPKLIYHEKWGIEKYSDRLSYFKTQVTNRDKDIVRYLPATNFDSAVSKAKTEFIDKFENIAHLISLFSKLNTEESEIVSTLYACWNDLLFKRVGLVTGDLIINEFKTNWHPSKERFHNEQLNYWLEWMHTNDLIPDGTGPRCSKKDDAA